MELLKGSLKLAFGLGLIAAGITLQVLWVVFCFGSIIIGVVMLIWFPQFLLGPFVFLCMPGWELTKSGSSDMRPKLNAGRVARKIAGVVLPQVVQIEAKGFPCTLDYQVLGYVMALSLVATRRPLSIIDGVDVTGTLFPGQPYLLAVKNLRFGIPYADGDYKEFWAWVKRIHPVAQQEFTSGKGCFLLSHHEEWMREKGLNAASAIRPI